MGYRWAGGFPEGGARSNGGSPTMEMISKPIKLISAIILIIILANSYLQLFLKTKKSKLIASDVVILIGGMTCNHCIESITKTLNRLENVSVLSIDLKTGMAKIKCPNEDIKRIENEIVALGFKIKK